MSPTKSPATGGSSPPPPLLRSLVKWGLLGGIVGVLVGVSEGWLLGTRLPADQQHLATYLVLDRGLVLGGLGAIFGIAGMLVEWALRKRRKQPA